MRTFRSLLLVAIGGALLAGPLSAQKAGYVQWRGVNGAWSGYSNSATGSSPWYVYTSPYKAGFWIPGNYGPPSPYMPPSGAFAFGPTVDIFCVDFINAANTGSYTAYFTNLGQTPGKIGITTRTGTTLTEYLEAAYLAQQIKVVGVNSGAAGDINGAIWQIMNGEPKYRLDGSTWSSAGIDSWIAAAEANYKTVNAQDWVVVTDLNAAGKLTGGSQEYLTQVTPEPATMLLLGTGLLVMMLGAGAVRRLSA